MAPCTCRTPPPRRRTKPRGTGRPRPCRRRGGRRQSRPARWQRPRRWWRPGPEAGRPQGCRGAWRAVEVGLGLVAVEVGLGGLGCRRLWGQGDGGCGRSVECARAAPEVRAAPWADPKARACSWPTQVFSSHTHVTPRHRPNNPKHGHGEEWLGVGAGTSDAVHRRRSTPDCVALKTPPPHSCGAESG